MKNEFTKYERVTPLRHELRTRNTLPKALRSHWALVFLLSNHPLHVELIVDIRKVCLLVIEPAIAELRLRFPFYFRVFFFCEGETLNGIAYYI